ncbi:MAG: DMT family transporter [Defluviicoccus sp.]|nr:DMT family transporter [Defluviicoccus sp.]MDE0275978.1 DMT family transporter [Defluviicoccus sp.]
MTDRPKSSFLAGDGIAHLLMAQAALIFALNYVIGRWAAGEVAPYTLGFTRWTVGALVLLPFAWHPIRRDGALLRRHWKLLCLLGFLMPLMGAGITYVALNYTTAINGGVIQTSLPVLILLLAWIILGDRTTGLQIFGVVLAVVGLLYMISRGDPAVLLGLDFNRGDAVLLLCNLCLAGYGVAARLMPREVHTLTLLTMVCAVGAACHVPFFAVELIEEGLPPASTRAVVSLLFVAFFPSVVAILGWNVAIARLGPSRAGFYMYLVPVFSAAIAVPFLGETLNVYHLIGAALIVAGVTVSSRKPKADATA